MTRARAFPIAASVAALALTTSCWVDSIAHEVDPLIPDRPPTVADWRASAERSGTSGAGLVPGEGSAEALALPELDQLPEIAGGTLEPPPTLLGLLPGGLRAVVTEASGEVCWIRLTIPNRTLPGSEVGVAEIAARLAVETPIAEPRRPTLRQTVESRGGQLDVTVDGRTTRLTIAAPPDDWRWLLKRLVETVRIAPGSPESFQAIRDDVVRDMTTRYGRSPMTAATERVNAFETQGPARWIAITQDATPVRIEAFRTEAWRANGSVLALRVPGESADAIMAAAREATSDWATGETRLLPDAVPMLPPAQGVFWAPAEGTSEVAVLLDVASTSVPLAAARLTALELLTASGSGGRLAEALAEESLRGVHFESELHSNGVHRQLVLTARVPPEDVPRIHNAVQKAIRHCLQRPPGLEEIARAARRARLRLAFDLREPERWLDEVTRSFIGGARPDVLVDESGIQPFEGEAPHPWLTTLSALERPGGIDVRPVFEQWSEVSPLVLVIGGEPGEFARSDRFTPMPDAVLPEAQRAAIEASPDEQAEAARGYVDLAVRALGGAERLTEIHGFHGQGTTRSGRGPQVTEEFWFRDDDRLRLIRRVLATTIETAILPDRIVERSGDEEVTLRREDVRPLLEAAHRHPLSLMADYVRGRSQYRLVSLRPQGDRSMAVLERVSEAVNPLRIEVDTGSGLIRAVVAAEERAEGRVYVREEYRDYRTISGGIRAPFHRATLLDDGVAGLVTEWTLFDVTELEDEDFLPQAGR